MEGLPVDGLTPTQRRLCTVLWDGQPHSYTELMRCLDDDLAGLGALHYHISMLRRTLLPRGEALLCVSFKR